MYYYLNVDADQLHCMLNNKQFTTQSNQCTYTVIHIQLTNGIGTGLLHAPYQDCYCLHDIENFWLCTYKVGWKAPPCGLGELRLYGEVSSGIWYHQLHIKMPIHVDVQGVP